MPRSEYFMPGVPTSKPCAEGVSAVTANLPRCNMADEFDWTSSAAGPSRIVSAPLAKMISASPDFNTSLRPATRPSPSCSGVGLVRPNAIYAAGETRHGAGSGAEGGPEDRVEDGKDDGLEDGRGVGAAEAGECATSRCSAAGHGCMKMAVRIAPVPATAPAKSKLPATHRHLTRRSRAGALGD